MIAPIDHENPSIRLAELIRRLQIIQAELEAQSPGSSETERVQCYLGGSNPYGLSAVKFTDEDYNGSCNKGLLLEFRDW